VSEYTAAAGLTLSAAVTPVEMLPIIDENKPLITLAKIQFFAAAIRRFSEQLYR
jgi:UTP-glucose-1-phosphate uridylyltransferase